MGLALALGLGDLILSFLPKPKPTVKYALLTAAGVVLLVGGPTVWLRRKSLGRPASSAEAQREPSGPGSPVLVGSGIAGLEVLTAFPYFTAIALIVGSSVSRSAKLFLLLLYCVVYAAPLFVIAGMCIVMGDRAAAVLRPVIGWLLARWPVLVAPLAAVLGVALVTYGVVHLT